VTAFASPETASLHAGCILLGEAGILIRGESGSGKSAAALAMLDAAAESGMFAALVADDRVLLSQRSGRIVARPPATIAGLLEVRGLGVVRLPHEPAAVLRLVVDLVPTEQVQRLPDDEERRASLLGVILPRLAATADASLFTRVRLALAAGNALDS
jgi:serine kinase of HPr protein (carbohydrate metabolism regulator)